MNNDDDSDIEFWDDLEIKPNLACNNLSVPIPLNSSPRKSTKNLLTMSSLPTKLDPHTKDYYANKILRIRESKEPEIIIQT